MVDGYKIKMHSAVNHHKGRMHFLIIGKTVSVYLLSDRNYLKILAPKISVSTNRIIKIKNNTFAISAEPAAIPPKPKMAAMIEITKKIAAHLSIR